MNDLISRQEAIEIADAIWTVTGDKNVAKVWQQLKDLPSAQPERQMNSELETVESPKLATYEPEECKQKSKLNADDLISRQDTYDVLTEYYHHRTDIQHDALRDAIDRVPSAEPTLYGYKIEHLAYIAKVMEKEGVTAEYAARTFDDMRRVIKMIIEEAQQKVEEALNERFNQ